MVWSVNTYCYCVTDTVLHSIAPLDFSGKRTVTIMDETTIQSLIINGLHD